MGGSCRSARRARSMRTPTASMWRRGSASRRSISFPTGLLPAGSLAGGRQDRRRAEPRTSADREGQWRRRHRQGRVGRASGRPEPPASVGRRTADHDAGLARQRSRAGRPGQARAWSSRCFSMPQASGCGNSELRPMEAQDIKRLIDDGGRAGHCRERRADRARPGDRRRRPRPQHEARLRGGAGRGRGNHRQALAGGAAQASA